MKSLEIVSLAAFLTFVFGMFSTVGAQQQQKRQDGDSAKFVTIARVKAPAAATDEILRSGFIKAVPTYQKIEGLEFKAFSLEKTDGGNFFGGIYLWKNKESAAKWFSPEWFERVRATYGTEGTVNFYEILADTSYFPDDYDFGGDKAAAIFVSNLTAKDSKIFTKKTVGMLRSYFVKTASGECGAIILFVNQQTAKLFTEKRKIGARDFFATPVLLNNVKKGEAAK